MTIDFNIPDLGPESFSTINRLTSQFAAKDAPERWGIYQGLDDGSPLSVVATWIERTVFSELYGNSNSEVAEEFSPFSDQTVWTVIVHHPSNQAVGAARCLVGPARQLMAPNDLNEIWNLSWDESCAVVGADPDGSFIEAASFSVLPEWRSSDRLWPVKIFGCIYMHMLEDLGADWAIQIINPDVKRVFLSWGTPFVSIAPPRDFNGVPFEPAMIPRQPGRPWFKTKDQDFHDLVQQRDGHGRGGTRLPAIDLDNKPLVVRLDDQLRTDRSDRLNPSSAVDG